MMHTRKKDLLLTAVALGFLLAAHGTAARSPSQTRAQQLRRRVQGLEAYQRYTPPPAPVDEEEVATAGPTSLAPTDAPTSAPTEAPTIAEVEPEKDDNKDNDKEKDEETTEEPTEAPEPAEPEEPVEEESPAEPVEEETPAEPVEESATDQTDAAPSQGSQGSLFSDSVQHSDSIGEVFVDFSLWSPTEDTLELDFEKLKEGATQVIHGLVCDAADPISDEKGPEFCAVRTDILLKDAATASLEGDDATIMALSATNVDDASGVVHNSDLLTWSTWRMSWSVTQLGAALEQHIGDLHDVDGETLTESEKNVKGLALLQQMMAIEMETSLRNGEFQNGLNLYLGDDFEVAASVVGEEINKFGSLLLPTKGSAAEGVEEANGEDGDGNSLLIVLFFAGLGVAAIVVVALIYFTFSSRRKAKNAAKEEGSNTGTESNPDSNKSSPVKAREAAAVKQDNQYVIEHEGALQEEPSQQQQTHQKQLEPAPQQWEEESVAEGDAGGEGDQNDEESVQLGAQSAAGGRSVGQSSMYTAGSGISAITGVSGLEHSDTWSVGSMSIDLADWG